MAKFNLVVFPLAMYAGNTNGSSRKHLHAPELTRVVGQGQRVLYHGKIQFAQGQGSLRVKFKVYHGALLDSRPSDDGFLVKLKSGGTGNQDEVIFSTEGNFAFETEGNLMGRLDTVMEIYDNGAQYAVQGQVILCATVDQG